MAPGPTLRRLEPVDFAEAYRWARRQRLLRASDPSAIFIDFDILDERLDHLQRVFPAGTLHAVAIKANPLLPVLRHIVARGFGLEAASFEEVLLAKRAGVPSERLVWDSPAKRQAEIDYCERHFPGLVLNANCVEELERLAGCRNLRLGLRVNPMVDTGSPGLLAVSEAGSKFGEPILHRQRILEAFRSLPRLVGLHMHVGSDVRRLDSVAEALTELVALAGAIDRRCRVRGLGRRIRFLDVGGGFATEYGAAPQPGLECYAGIVRRATGSDGNRRLITEYGRFVHAHAGWLVSDIEYSFERAGRRVHVLHHGADMFVREVYWTAAPRHRVCALDAMGALRSDDEQPCALAGPLCFAGDFLEHECGLPPVAAGDKVIVADVGANTFALWSHHCSRAFPKVIGYSTRRREMRVLKRRETPAHATAVWA